jgi:hypothetical protein
MEDDSVIDQMRKDPIFSLYADAVETLLEAAYDIERFEQVGR